MDSSNIEESTSLTTMTPSTKGHHHHHHHHCHCQRLTPKSMLNYQNQNNNRERRIRLIRLGAIYYLTWIILIILATSIWPYIYLLFPRPQCWNHRQIQVNLSLIVAIITSVISLLLLIIQCLCTRIKTTKFRRNFCRTSFFLFTLIAIINFIIAIYFFNMFSCYFDQHDGNDGDDDDMMAILAGDWLTNTTIRYDLKIVAVIHLICSILSFFTGIGFAIIRHNFKYVLRIDLH
ncbi:uncharacterized protein LOC124493143 [Dermatophagoides farinae]|uniref:uncharacterized protein LOC124493143 n=1 Tax=Dermatophagoides farinae TaxID=6954 RepID=UPI003F5ED2FF